MAGFEVWRGASWIDGAPIVMIATGIDAAGSENTKTGSMIQTWIIRRDIDPVAAVRAGADAAICGDCPHRGSDGFAGRSCYVNVGQAPQSVYRAWQRGAYPRFAPHRTALATFGRAVRLGAYGDPALVPASILRALTIGARLHTGYTHRWRDAAAGHARAYCMASCDSARDIRDALAAGWRAFHVGAQGDALAAGRAIVCPASAEHAARTGRRTTCDACGLCSGTTRAGHALGAAVAPIITIAPHGAGAKHARARVVALTIGAT